LRAGTGKDATAKHCRRDDESGQTADIFVFHMWFCFGFPRRGMRREIQRLVEANSFGISQS
jgi:hypothetical protein